MKKNMFSLSVISLSLVFLSSSIAFAQEPEKPKTPQENLDIAAKEVILVATLTTGTIAILRKHLFKEFEGWGVILASGACGLVYSLLLGAMGFADSSNWLARIGIGIVGGISASGAVDGVRAIQKIK